MGLVVLVAFSGCGGGGEDTASAPTTTVVVTETVTAGMALEDADPALRKSAVDAAAHFIALMGVGKDTAAQGDAYDELAGWLNGDLSLERERVLANIELICEARLPGNIAACD
jgi:hypothetical protein